jgi:hypothetical protein
LAIKLELLPEEKLIVSGKNAPIKKSDLDYIRKEALIEVQLES